MKNIPFCALLCFLFSNAFAQSLDWVRAISGPNTDKIHSTVIDQNGNVYSTGEFWATSDFDPGSGLFTLSSQGSSDIFVQKCDPNGNFLWAIGLGSSGPDIGRAIDIDTNGNVYITGEFRGTIDFDPGSGSTLLTSGGYSDIFVLKLNTNGAFVWAKNFESSLDFSIGRDIKVDDSGNVYTTGKMKGTVDFDPGAATNIISALGSDIFIHKLTPNGNLDWVRTYGGSGQWVEEGQALEIDDQGDLYISGIFMSTVDFDAGLGTSNLTIVGNHPNVFVLKLKPDASFVWAIGYGSASTLFPSGEDLAIRGDDLYVTGTFNGTVDFDPGAGVQNVTGQGSGDIYIEKLDTAGNFQWVKTFGNFGIDRGISIATDYFSNIYTTGIFSGTVDFDPDPNVTNQIGSEGNFDIFVLKLDEMGTFDWVFTLGDNGADEGYSLNVDQFGTNIWTSGAFAGTVDFDPSGVTSSIASAGLSDGFVQKINQVVPCIPSFSQLSPEICFGETYVSPSGNYMWSQAATYTDTLINAAGCDSVITIEISVISIDTSVSELNNVLSANQIGALYQWIDCDNNNTPISGETNASFTASSNGNYAVEITWQNCTATSACYEISTIGIVEPNYFNTKVYPNPTTEGITLEILGTSGEVLMTVFNPLGQLIRSEIVSKKFEFELLEQKGLYIVHLSDAKHQTTLRIVKL